MGFDMNKDELILEQIRIRKKIEEIDRQESFKEQDPVAISENAVLVGEVFRLTFELAIIYNSNPNTQLDLTRGRLYLESPFKELSLESFRLDREGLQSAVNMLLAIRTELE